MERLLNAIRTDARVTESYTGQAEISAQVMDALCRVPREEFVPDEASHLAYQNHPLPIGHGQTISQPFIVALMTDLLEVRPEHRILEIGTGSGYQAAVLAELEAEIYSIEIIPDLAAAATTLLEHLEYTHVHLTVGDGWHGWAEEAPFNGIIVTAVAEDIPPRLVEQLSSGGRLVLPLDQPSGGQVLVVVEKQADGSTRRRDVLPVQFVPLTGDH
ncbi:MAG: protein-L-isoaspartate(D-aspartate) O-methyltransferase [Gammaproteobacteria bacterium]|nr:MAG: protein-L-isoaspartate(D-aspartate) O-methyltransferase [Gammaproteobacteria bacterium]